MSKALGTALKLLALALAVAGMCGLGVWQYRVGRAKQALIDQFQAALRQPAPALLTRAGAAHMAGPLVPVRAEGVYDAVHQLLLLDQSHGDEVGFDVWTPLRSDDGALILVDRGWLPLSQRQAVPAPPAGPQGLRGIWRGLPAPGLRLHPDNCSPQGFPRGVEYPTEDDLRCLLGVAPLDGLLLLDAAAPGGFLRDWHAAPPGFPPVRHYAYAVQWFALAATLLVLSLVFMFKRSP